MYINLLVFSIVTVEIVPIALLTSWVILVRPLHGASFRVGNNRNI